MENERKMALVMDLCLANEWGPARLARLMQILATERGHKLKYTKGSITAHINWRKNHPLKNKPEMTDETKKVDAEDLKKYEKLAPAEIVGTTPKATKEPSTNKPEKTPKAKVDAKTEKVKA